MYKAERTSTSAIGQIHSDAVHGRGGSCVLDGASLCLVLKHEQRPVRERDASRFDSLISG